MTDFSPKSRPHLVDTTASRVEPPDTPLCARCELGGLTPTHAEIAFWRDGGLVVVRNIPAMHCPSCGEDYVGEIEALSLDRMRGEGFTTGGVQDRMIVPVVDFVALDATRARLGREGET